MDDAEPALAAAKDELRRSVRRRRVERGEPERERLAERLRDVVLAAPVLDGARTVACYAALPHEPGTGPLRAALAAAGVRVLLPVVSGAVGAPLDWAADQGVLRPAALGIGEPSGDRLGADAVAAADVILVPALLVDTLGRRLGQGGGYYDATLAALGRHPPVVALVHDDELVDAAAMPVPAGPGDVRVDAVATPARWWDVPA